MIRKLLNYILSNKFNYLDMFFFITLLLASTALDFNIMVDLAIIAVWAIFSEYLKYRLIKEV